MAIGPSLMREVTLAVQDTGTAASYLAVGGITQLEHSPSTETADASTFDVAGRTLTLPVSRGDEFTGSALRYVDVATGDRDPGQDRAESLSREIGQPSIVSWQVTFAEGSTMTFDAHCQVKITGGGVNDLETWEVTVSVYGTPTFAPAV